MRQFSGSLACVFVGRRKMRSNVACRHHEIFLSCCRNSLDSQRYSLSGGGVCFKFVLNESDVASQDLSELGDHWGPWPWHLGVSPMPCRHRRHARKLLRKWGAECRESWSGGRLGSAVGEVKEHFFSFLLENIWCVCLMCVLKSWVDRIYIQGGV